MKKAIKKQTPFSKILKSIMKERGLTMRQVASMAEVSASTINDWQSGSAPENYLAVKKLSKQLGISFSFLLTGEEEGSRSQPSITEVFEDGDFLFDGFAKITIQRLLPRKSEK